MKLAITGSRHYYPHSPSWTFAAICMNVANLNATEIIHGGAVGVDSIAEDAAEQCQIPTRVLRPDYKAHANCPKYAPLARNIEIVKLSDLVIAFWDGKSKGTLHTIKQAEAAGKLFKVYGPDGTPIEGFSLVPAGGKR